MLRNVTSGKMILISECEWSESMREKIDMRLAIKIREVYSNGLFRLSAAEF